jgi:hypothetical protein
MKQLIPLFLFLLPCLAWAQYPSNGNQKITLGEQTSADGLVYRGVLADTGIITPSSDTSAYIILDTVNHRFYNYNRATNVWSMAGVGSISSGLTGVLPVENGGTNTSTAFTAGSVVFAGSGGTYTQDNTGLFYNSTNKRLAIGQSGNLTGASLSVRGGIHIIDPDTSIFSDALIYIYPKEQTGIGANASEFALQVAGPGSTTTSHGPYFFIKGKDFSRIGGQRGAMFFSGAQGIVSPTGYDGSITLHPQEFIELATGDSYNIRLKIIKNGNVGIGQTTPTAVLHLKAGTATASTAPLKFTSGTNLTTAEAGAMEFNGTNLFFSPSTTRHTVNHGLTGSSTLDFPSTTTLLSADLTITVTGAAQGDVVSLGVPNAAVNANTSYSAWVSAANTVTVRFNNYSSGTVDPASALFKVFVTK